jgi:hypothetical protein
MRDHRGRRAALAVALLAVVLVGCDATGTPPNAQPTPSSAGVPGTLPTMPTARPTATPAATVDPGQAALLRFDALITDPRLSYHVASSAVARGGRLTLRFSQSLNVSGSDYAGTVNSTGPGASGRSSVVYVRGVVYIKGPSTYGRWVSARRADRYVQIAPLLYLRTEDIDYVKPVIVNGKALFLLFSTDSYAPDMARMLGLGGMNVGVNRVWLEVYVTATGIPVRAVYRVEAGGISASGKPVVVGQAVFTFSSVGASFRIVRPTH